MLSKEQKNAIEIMKTGANVSLSGEGGTGKSYTIKKYLEGLTEEERGHTLIMAPTGVAARNIGGATIHRSLGLSKDPYGPYNVPPAKIAPVLETADRIIIDEISMCRFDIFGYVAKCIHCAETTLNKKNPADCCW